MISVMLSRLTCCESVAQSVRGNELLTASCRCETELLVGFCLILSAASRLTVQLSVELWFQLKAGMRQTGSTDDDVTGPRQRLHLWANLNCKWSDWREAFNQRAILYVTLWQLTCSVRVQPPKTCSDWWCCPSFNQYQKWTRRFKHKQVYFVLEANDVSVRAENKTYRQKSDTNDVVINDRK